MGNRSDVQICGVVRCIGTCAFPKYSMNEIGTVRGIYLNMRVVKAVTREINNGTDVQRTYVGECASKDCNECDKQPYECTTCGMYLNFCV